jgi:hypothetical protein
LEKQKNLYICCFWFLQNFQKNKIIMCGESTCLKYEKNRLETFAFGGWSNPEMKPEGLAAAGFCYTGVKDIVRCAFCNLFVCCWTAGDDPKELHRSCSSKCSIVTGENCENIPLPQPSPVVFVPKPGGEDVCGVH